MRRTACRVKRGATRQWRASGGRGIGAQECVDLDGRNGAPCRRVARSRGDCPIYGCWGFLTVTEMTIIGIVISPHSADTAWPLSRREALKSPGSAAGSALRLVSAELSPFFHQCVHHSHFPTTMPAAKIAAPVTMTVATNIHIGHSTYLTCWCRRWFSANCRSISAIFF